MKTYVLDIQRNSVHDGPGLRTTVFLKGCPLTCNWCHNPESQEMDRELSYRSHQCVGCGKCVLVCKQGVHEIKDNQHTVERSKCIQCGACVKACPAQALSISGEEKSIDDVFEVIDKDRTFYEMSGGGVTISGGEPLVHKDYVQELLEKCMFEGIHTCIETSGHVGRKNIEAILPYVDLFLYDCKVSNEGSAKKYIGGSLSIIEENLTFILEKGKSVVLRCPIIPTVNDDIEHFKFVAKYAKEWDNIVKVELLPYHNFGVVKGKNVDILQEEYGMPTEEDKNAWLAKFNELGVGDKVIIS